MVRSAETVAVSISLWLVASADVRRSLISYWPTSGVLNRPPLRTGEEDWSVIVRTPAVSNPASPSGFQGIASQLAAPTLRYCASKATVAFERPPWSL